MQPIKEMYILQQAALNIIIILLYFIKSLLMNQNYIRHLFFTNFLTSR